MNITREKILAFAPDQATVDRAEKLANTGSWVMLEGNANLLWGRCRGSSNSTYKTAIQLANFRCTCSCPVRKKPCKHLTALLLLYLNHSDGFRITDEMPEWVSSFANELSAKTKTTTATDEQKTAARDQRRQERLALMTRGINDLENWLLDMMRQGLAAVEEQNRQFWQELSARMVDTQLSALGPRIRTMQLLPTTQADWPRLMLQELAELYLLVSGFKKLEQLPNELRDQLLRVAGINDKKADILALSGIADEWGVIGSFESVNIDGGAFRRIWLKGRKSKATAMILDYSYNNMGYEQQWKKGHIYKGELVFYPGSYKIRALVKSPEPTGEDIQLLKGEKNMDAFFQQYAAALAKNPWIGIFPCCVHEVIPVKIKDGLILVDSQKKQMSVLARDEIVWILLALSGGHPITVFGEWSGEGLLPLSVVAEGRFTSLSVS